MYFWARSWNFGLIVITIIEISSFKVSAGRLCSSPHFWTFSCCLTFNRRCKPNVCCDTFHVISFTHSFQRLSKKLDSRYVDEGCLVANVCMYVHSINKAFYYNWSARYSYIPPAGDLKMDNSIIWFRCRFSFQNTGCKAVYPFN